MKLKNDQYELHKYIKNNKKIPGQFFIKDIKKYKIDSSYYIKEEYEIDVDENKKLYFFIILKNFEIYDCRVN